MDAQDYILLALLLAVAAIALGPAIRQAWRCERGQRMTEAWRREMISRRWKEF
ncbi:MAG TPA: hypothetical protein VID27_06085 [Blastocatellia bacterium]